MEAESVEKSVERAVGQKHEGRKEESYVANEGLEAAGRVARTRAELQRRGGSALQRSVCTVDSNASGALDRKSVCLPVCSPLRVRGRARVRSP